MNISGIDTTRKHYTTDSLRRGGAHTLAINHASIESIKHQGGWRSTTFLQYTIFTKHEVSEEIRQKF